MTHVARHSRIVHSTQTLSDPRQNKPSILHHYQSISISVTEATTGVEPTARAASTKLSIRCPLQVFLLGT